jgi:hypothetical protein
MRDNYNEYGVEEVCYFDACTHCAETSTIVKSPGRTGIRSTLRSSKYVAEVFRVS